MSTDDCVVRLEHVSRIYHQGEQTIRALDRVDLTVRKGEMAVVAGPSGSGKTTLLNIAAEPALVLADEPTANLDSSSASSLLELMVQLNRDYGTTFLFSTHDPRVMQRARRMIRLVDGRIESDTPTHEV